MKQKLAHEVGHIFRYFVNGDTRSGFGIPAYTGAGWTLVDSNNYSEDLIINSANGKMRKGNLKYGYDYVDDFRLVVYSKVTPGPTANILGDLSPRKMVPRNPTAFDIYRLGARMVAAQRR
ncbi:MAG TPA: hypothetical protein VNJ29_02105 [Candidatus Nitrosotenuis sp.]|nr:hypothetical protein [Candidatus Nitrosotenuis sp.]